MIEFAAIEDNKILVDALRTWAGALPDMRLSAVTDTVGELLAAGIGIQDVVLLDPVFMMPLRSDERYRWVRARLPVLGEEELRELLIDAWCMVMPKTIAARYLESQGITRG